jgi:DNA-binding response OmpR family regulator
MLSQVEMQELARLVARAVIEELRGQPAPLHAKNAAIAPVAYQKLLIDFGRQRVEYDAKPVSLTPQEFDTLSFLVVNVGHVVTRGQLVAYLSPEKPLRANYIDILVGRLRTKLGAAGGWISTKARVGFVFEPPDC